MPIVGKCAGLLDKVSFYDKKISQREAVLMDRREKFVLLLNELQDLGKEAEILEKVEQVLLSVSTRVLGKSVDVIDHLVTAGLKLVFEDQQLEFKTYVEKARGKTAVRFELLDKGKAFPLLESYGGGVLVIVGVLLRVVTILVCDMRRVLFLDETLSHLSDQYIGPASRMMKDLCARLDFTIVMISHAEEFATYADFHYNAEDRGNGLQLKLIRATNQP